MAFWMALCDWNITHDERRYLTEIPRGIQFKTRHEICDDCKAAVRDATLVVMKKNNPKEV